MDDTYEPVAQVNLKPLNNNNNIFIFRGWLIKQYNHLSNIWSSMSKKTEEVEG